MDLLRSGIKKSTSTIWIMPKPLHVSHAPSGELKLNKRGCKSTTEKPHFGHAYFAENNISSFFVIAKAKPSAFLSAVSSES